MFTLRVGCEERSEAPSSTHEQQKTLHARQSFRSLTPTPYVHTSLWRGGAFGQPVQPEGILAVGDGGWEQPPPLLPLGSGLLSQWLGMEWNPLPVPSHRQAPPSPHKGLGRCQVNCHHPPSLLSTHLFFPFLPIWLTPLLLDHRVAVLGGTSESKPASHCTDEETEQPRSPAHGLQAGEPTGRCPWACRSYSSGEGFVRSPAFSQTLALPREPVGLLVRKGWYVPSCVQAGHGSRDLQRSHRPRGRHGAIPCLQACHHPS